MPPEAIPPPPPLTMEGLRKVSRLRRAGVEVPLGAEMEGWREMVALPVPRVAAAVRSKEA